MSTDLKLSDAERQQILEQRARADKKRWLGEGIFIAADHLEQLGKEACGGDGEAINPATGERWAESFFQHAQMLRMYGSRWQIEPDRSF